MLDMKFSDQLIAQVCKIFNLSQGACLQAIDAIFMGGIPLGEESVDAVNSVDPSKVKP